MENFFSWQAPEYNHRPKTADWYWAVGIIALSAAVTAIIFDNVLFAILIIIGAFALSLHAAKKPEIMDIEINDRGLRMSRYYFPFSNLESFWVEEEHGMPRIIFKSKRILMPHIVIPLDGIDGNELRLFLKNHLPEEEQTEPLFELILEYLGF